MNRTEKENVVAELNEILEQAGGNFYIADTAGLTVIKDNELRRLCFSKGIHMKNFKNTLIKKALVNANIDTEGFAPVLKGSSTLFWAESYTAPAKLIKQFRATNPVPVLKAAYIEQSLYVGDNQLDTLTTLKSREELIGDVVLMLQTPARNVISALQSGGNKIAGLVKTLSEREG